MRRNQWWIIYDRFLNGCIIIENIADHYQSLIDHNKTAPSLQQLWVNVSCHGLYCVLFLVSERPCSYALYPLSISWNGKKRFKYCDTRQFCLQGFVCCKVKDYTPLEPSHCKSTSVLWRLCRRCWHFLSDEFIIFINSKVSVKHLSMFSNLETSSLRILFQILSILVQYVLPSFQSVSIFLFRKIKGIVCSFPLSVANLRGPWQGVCYPYMENAMDDYLLIRTGKTVALSGNISS